MLNTSFHFARTLSYFKDGYRIGMVFTVVLYFAGFLSLLKPDTSFLFETFDKLYSSRRQQYIYRKKKCSLDYIQKMSHGA